jgi:hypothetical protein
MPLTPEELAQLEREIPPFESQAERWRREDAEDEARRQAEREEQRKMRERAERAAAQNLDDRVRSLISENWEVCREAVGGVIGEMIDDLRQELLEKMRVDLRVAILEQSGLVPRVKGTFSEHETYSALDICALNGGLWLAKFSNPGPLPGEGWQLMSCRGSKGERGLVGPRGERGEVGPQGEPGPGITGWKVDREKFRITPLLKGGHYGPPVDLLPMFQEYDRQIHGGAPATKRVEVEPPRRDRPEAAPIVNRIVSAPAVEPPIEGQIE